MLESVVSRKAGVDILQNTEPLVFSTVGTHMLIAAVTGKSIKVVRISIAAAADQTVTISSDVNIIQKWIMAQYSVAPPNVDLVGTEGSPVLQTNEGEALKASLTVAIATQFYIQYVMV